MLGDIIGVVWVSLLAGVGITASYSFALLGTSRYAEARRAGRSAAALGYGALAGIFLLIFAGGIVVAVQILLTKS
jgi:hypothetical protein